jgi:ribosomal protein S3
LAIEKVFPMTQAGKDFADLLHEDLKIREYITKRLKDASVSKVEIELQQTV